MLKIEENIQNGGEGNLGFLGTAEAGGLMAFTAKSALALARAIGI